MEELVSKKYDAKTLAKIKEIENKRIVCPPNNKCGGEDKGKCDFKVRKCVCIDHSKYTGPNCDLTPENKKEYIAKAKSLADILVNKKPTSVEDKKDKIR